MSTTMLMEAGRRLDNRAAVEVRPTGATIGPVLRRRDEHLVRLSMRV
jgi:hypothetical protein